MILFACVLSSGALFLVTNFFGAHLERAIFDLFNLIFRFSVAVMFVTSLFKLIGGEFQAEFFQAVIFFS